MAGLLLEEVGLADGPARVGEHRRTAGGRGKAARQVVARTACRMTLVTTPGSEIMARCGAFNSVMRACAFSAMASCNAGGMAWSAVPTTAQDGMVFQAGAPDGWVRAIVASGAWSAARTRASRAGSPLAMHAGNALWVMKASPVPAGAPGNGTTVRFDGSAHDPG